MFKTGFRTHNNMLRAYVLWNKELRYTKTIVNIQFEDKNLKNFAIRCIILFTDFTNLFHHRDLERTVSNSGLTLVLTLTPFVSTDSTSFNEGLQKGLFVMERKLNITRDIPALTWYKVDIEILLNRNTLRLKSRHKVVFSNS